MTAMLAPEALRSSGLFSIGSLGAEVRTKITWAKKTNTDGSESKVLQIVDQPVFRSGTFRDSWGIQTTWEYMHIDQMVLNHNHLLSTGVFENIPVRKGHGGAFDDPMNSLVGWHTGLRAEKFESKIDGNEYNYLLASYEIFDQEAQTNVNDGNWKNRSSEVGYFLTNAEAEYWPVYQGFAFVDIPAVEGLNFSKANPPSKHTIFMERDESEVPQPKKTPTPPAPHSAATPPSPTGPIETVPPTEPVTPEEQPTEPVAPVVPDAEPIPPATEPETPSGDHSRGTAFNINGQPTADFAAVQAHISTLEAAQDEQRITNINEFVNGLATGNKILASQIPDLSEFAQSLSPAQYAKWSASYGSVPSSSLFGQHGADAGDNGGAPADQVTADESEKARLVGIVGMHRAGNMTEEKVKATASYKKLNALLPNEYPI